MKRAIVCSDAGPHGPDLAADAAMAGFDVRTAADCSQIARLVLTHEADIVILYQTCVDDAFFMCMATLGSLSSRPMLVFTSDVGHDNVRRSVEAGIHGYVVGGYDARRIRPLAILAQARFQRDRSLADELKQLHQRLSEGPLVERAKAILMGARQMREDEAFQTLHMAAMESRRRVGQVARTVIETAVYAEAVNRAGQLRMLSQRLVKLYALLCLRVRTADMRALMRASLERVEDNLASLRRNLPRDEYTDLLEVVDAPWRVLADHMRAEPDAGRLRELDGLAEEVLERSDRLVSSLELEHLARTLRIVNLCGRQRMLSQRMAKEALMAAVLGPVAAASSPSGGPEAEFAAALAQLRSLEFTTPGIAAGLGEAAETWARFQDALQYAERPAGQAAVGALSEELLGQFERLTGQYEHGIQALIG